MHSCAIVNILVTALWRQERHLSTRRVKARLDERTVRKPDGWRVGFRASVDARSGAVRLLLEERLCGGRRERRTESVSVSPARCCPATDRLAALYVLERVPGFGPVKFREMHEAGVNPQTAIESPDLLPFRGRTGDKLRAAVGTLSSADMTLGRSRATEQLESAERHSAAILVHGDAEYPKHVYASNNPVPVLYVRGNPAVWAREGSVAVVGSRNTRDPYLSLAREFATVAVRKDMVVVSGFAVGADTIGHVAARDADGRTVCVMPCGLDNVFPPENRSLWEDLLAYPGAAFISEFGFGQRTSSLRLRKRNKLIVAFAQGVLVVQSADDGGAMNAYRFACEQRKAVATFRPDGSKDTTGNAVIGQDSRAGYGAFEATASQPHYETWLDGLSSWTWMARSGTDARGAPKS